MFGKGVATGADLVDPVHQAFSRQLGRDRVFGVLDRAAFDLGVALGAEQQPTHAGLAQGPARAGRHRELKRFGRVDQMHILGPEIRSGWPGSPSRRSPGATGSSAQTGRRHRTD